MNEGNSNDENEDDDDEDDDEDNAVPAKRRMVMSGLARREALMQKVLDGEAMSGAELREFGEAMAADCDYAEEFVLMRRIAADAGRLPRRQPSAGFAGRVMEAIRRAPAPGFGDTGQLASGQAGQTGQAGRAGRALGSLAAGQAAPAPASLSERIPGGRRFVMTLASAVFCVAVIGCVGAWALGTAADWWAVAPFGGDWDSLFETPWAAMDSALTALASAFVVSPLTDSALWLAVALAALAGGLNLWSARGLSGRM